MMMMMIIIIMVVFFVNGILKLFLYTRLFVASQVHCSPHFSLLFSSILLYTFRFLPVSQLAPCNVKHAAEMDLLLWTRSISLFFSSLASSVLPLLFFSLLSPAPPPPSPSRPPPPPLAFLKNRNPALA